MLTIPVGLKHALEVGECVLFLGAGVGAHLFNADGDPAPDAHDLTTQLVDKFSINTTDLSDLAKIAGIVESRYGRIELETFLRQNLLNLEPDNIYQWLFTLHWRAIFTTNYDYGIQRAYELLPNLKQRPITITSTSEIVSYDSRFEVPVYHLHGALFGESKSQIVITRSDYARFSERRRMLFELLKKEFATTPILYIGYSNRDNNWNTLFQEMTAEFYPSPMPRSYRIALNTDELDKELLMRNGIETIDGTLKDFYDAAIVALKLSDVEEDRLQREKANVPTDLKAIFDESPAAVIRLLDSWDYVNQANFHATPNVYDFLRGDFPNWALVGSRKFFERDIEEELYDELLDYATTTKNNPAVNILLGPAGYGVTTLLMALAAKLAVDKVGAVFMLKRTGSVLPGDIEFAMTIFKDTNKIPFFFIDNAAESGETLSSIVERLTSQAKRAMFFLGERLNEWRQYKKKPNAKEFGLDPLSEPEIGRLLDYLGENSALNVLADLSRDLQVAAIKERHRKELLVVLREATEGKNFDAIIEGEYRGISTPEARKAYLIVCCFHQNGAYVRADLLADLIKLSLIELYDAITDQTEGVIIFESIDESRNLFAARARHRTIANVVWERCGDPIEREQILHSSLDRLNLNFKADKDAFEDFVRSGTIVDSIQTLDGRTKFFETACKKDPVSPYVRQHYARMLHRADKHELALAQIDQAIALDSRVRVLYHTKAVILAELAINSESEEIARRRLAQSEALFIQGINNSPRDEYFYQGLARLYFGWAKRVKSDEEMTEYIAKAEGIISNGLTNSRIKDGLWIESGQIQAWLGNEPSHLKALENAVNANPNSVVARYLLGSAYLQLNRADKTIEILELLIAHHFDEFRAFIIYAKALEQLGRPYKEAIAILQQSRLQGLKDARFIATLGGMQFLDNRFTEANETFAESDKRGFSEKTIKEVHYEPLDPKDLSKKLHLTGKIAVIRAGYILIDNENFPRIICPASKYNGLIPEPNIAISFQMAFSAKGAVAVKPTPA